MQQFSLFSDNAEYDAFTAKFEAKKTTDDCFTPEGVYEAIADWVCREYDVTRESFVRPFWPGANYEAEEYPEGCVVVDNPPFSIVSKIVGWYVERGIKFFLFCPALRLIRNSSVTTVAVGAGIIYANGADVPTSFVTNLDCGLIRSAPSLYRAIKRANEEAKAARELPRYEYPPDVVTAARVEYLSKYGVDWSSGEKGVFISALDEQRAAGKSVYGGGILLPPAQAQAQAQARKEALGLVRTWTLSEREREIVRGLDYAAG